MCKGSTRASTENWSKFQSCLVINLATMYTCVAAAYKKSPSAPTDVQITSRTGTTVHLEWKPPSSNPSLVTKYKVIFTETSGRRHTETVHETRSTSISVPNLLPEKKYTVHIVAQGTEQTDLSQTSSFVQFSTSTRSQNLPVFTETVKLPTEATTVTLPCHLRQGATQKETLIWEKKVKSNRS